MAKWKAAQSDERIEKRERSEKERCGKHRKKFHRINYDSLFYWIYIFFFRFFSCAFSKTDERESEFSRWELFIAFIHLSFFFFVVFACVRWSILSFYCCLNFFFSSRSHDKICKFYFRDAMRSKRKIVERICVGKCAHWHSNKKFFILCSFSLLH